MLKSLRFGSENTGLLNMTFKVIVSRHSVFKMMSSYSSRAVGINGLCMPVASRDLRSVHGTLLPSASHCSGLVDALINCTLHFAINSLMSCMNWQKNMSLDMDISHEHKALWRFMVTEQGRCLCVILLLEENFRVKPRVSKVTWSLICQAGIWFYKIFSEFNLSFYHVLSLNMFWYCHWDLGGRMLLQKSLK